MEIRLSGFQCQKCGHQWRPRKPGIPVRCAACKSPYWNRPRQEETSQSQGHNQTISEEDREWYEPAQSADREGAEQIADFLAGQPDEPGMVSALRLLDKRVHKLETLLERVYDLALATSQAYYWTPEWQARERRADEDARLGRSTLYSSAEELIKDLNR